MIMNSDVMIDESRIGNGNVFESQGMVKMIEVRIQMSKTSNTGVGYNHYIWFAKLNGL